MYASIVIFIIIYIFDLAIAYAIAGPTGALFAMIALPIAIVIQQKLCMLSVGATRLEKLDDADQDKLRAVFEDVLQSAERQGYSFSKNPRIYLLESNELNAFSCGNCIVVNRGLINTICLRAVVCHEIKHYRQKDSYCSCLISSSVAVLMLILMFNLGVSVIAISIFTALLFGIVLGSTAAFISGSIVYITFNFLKNAILNIVYWISVFFQALLSQFTEYKADEFSAQCGFADELILFLKSTNDDARFTSLTQRLLSTHPSNAKRIERLNQIKNQLNGTLSLPFDL